MVPRFYSGRSGKKKEREEFKSRGGGVDLATSGINLSAREAGGAGDGRGWGWGEKKDRKEGTEMKMRPQTHRRSRNAGNKTTKAKKGERNIKQCNIGEAETMSHT